MTGLRHGRVLLALAAAAVALSLTACARTIELPPEPGSGSDDLKRSPCACLELVPTPVGPADMERYRQTFKRLQRG